MANIKNDVTREQILSVAKELFLENGYEKTTMRQIAKICGVNQGLAYYYFNGKTALALEIIQRYLYQFEEPLSMVVDSEKEPILYLLVRARFIFREISCDEKASFFMCGTNGDLPSLRPYTTKVHEAAILYSGDENLELEKAQMAMIISDGAWEKLTMKRNLGEINIGVNDMLDIIDVIRYTYLGIPESCIKDLISKSYEVLDQIPNQGFKL